MDPLLGYPPFSSTGEVFRPATWVADGILRDLAYPRTYGVQQLGVEAGLPTSGAFHMSGGKTTIDEMIATTTRGILVTRFSDVGVVDYVSFMESGYTRDGLWLIENGAISKAIKNFRFTESPLFALNQIEQIGTSVRVFHPRTPIAAPALKVRDFSFTSLADAV